MFTNSILSPAGRFYAPGHRLIKITHKCGLKGGCFTQAISVNSGIMRIPDEKIEEIRSVTDIVEIVSVHVRLKKRGKNFVGLCPFHQEKTPSFSVSPEKQMYYCFGCGEGGNVFTFIMRTDKVSFNEAVQTLAARAGISLPEPGAESTERSGNEPIYRALMIAARFFHSALTSTNQGVFALDYFRKRGFTDATIKQFGLGYAPRGWESLIQHATGQGVGVDDLEKSGLVIRRDDGTHYDRLRGRAIFPIFSTTGRVVAFAGRQLYDDDTLAKYINTPETPLYYKSKILYGLSMTRDEIRRREFALLVEGYTDLISLYQAGIKNVVASSGTALTEDQILLLSRYTPAIVIVYDADSAGSNAALRGVGLILEKGLDVRVVSLPEKEDPDSYIQGYGADAFTDLVDKSVSFIDFMASKLEQDGYFGTPEGQAKAVRSIMEILAKIPDELKRNFYIKSLSERYDLYETVLHRELENITRKEKRRQQILSVPSVRDDLRSEESKSESQTQATDDMIPLPVAESDLLKLLMEPEREVVEYILSHITVSELRHDEAIRLFEALIKYYRRTGSIDPSVLITNEAFVQYSRLISRLYSERYEISAKWEDIRGTDEFPVRMQMAIDVIRTIKRRNVLERIEQLRKVIKEHENRGEDSISLTRELHLLQMELKTVDSQYGALSRRV
jgi:DNA primase